MFAVLNQAIEQKKPAALISVIDPGGPPGRKLVAAESGVLWNGLEPETGAAVLSDLKGFFAEGRSGPAEVSRGDGSSLKFFVQLFMPVPRLVILGGGHVGAALSRMAALLDYEIIVIDDRPTFASRVHHPDAHRVLCEDFGRALDKLAATTLSDYIVIVTRGHRHDRICLEKLLGRPAAYIGMIGSRSRVRALLKELDGKGYDREELAKVHTPIGLAIGAVTEGEIALSILSEITKVRRSGGLRQVVQEEVLRELVTLEREGGRAVLAMIVKALGATPRKEGTWMLVHPDGRITGTIGGGCAEAGVRQEALQLINSDYSRVSKLNLTGDVAAEEGMACGGRMDIFLEPLVFSG